MIPFIIVKETPLSQETVKEGLLYLSGHHPDIPLGHGYVLPDGRTATVLAIGLHSRQISCQFYPELERLNENLTSVKYIVK